MTVASGMEPLVQRLSSAVSALGGDVPVPSGTSHSRTAGDLLAAATARLRHQRRHDEIWLLLTALSGAMPVEEEVLELARGLQLSDSDAAAFDLVLETGFEVATGRGQPDATLELATGGVVVDVTHTACSDLHTGIQRVIRETFPHWPERTDAVFVRWGDTGAGYQRLSPAEEARALHWSEWRPPADTDEEVPAENAGTPVLLVPWRSALLLPEVAAERESAVLRALASSSGNNVAVIGYDCVPVVSGDAVPLTEAEKFCAHLSVVKRAQKVIAISQSAAREFLGFRRMAAAQGLHGPDVVACPLPHAMRVPEVEPEPSSTVRVLVVGSHEPRKNHLLALAAAERLWQQGLDFSLRFVGGSGWNTGRFQALVAELQERGRDVIVRKAVSDAELQAEYRAARFTVFPSLHEGFGLPVAESLFLGTPVVTSRFGSLAEIAPAGSLLVDPRDEVDLTRAMESLLLDDVLLKKLQREASQMSRRTWQDYADDIWRQTLELVPTAS